MMLQHDEIDLHNLWMCSDAHFHLSDHINKPNSRYWCSNNTKQLHDQSLHSLKVTVRCAMFLIEIIGPYVFEDKNENAVTINSACYT